LLVDRKRGGEKITRKGKKSQLDALAASLILQAFLDGRLPQSQ
jgi:RNase H-fold protein (predicted Holliday junction resolvase)